MVMNNENALTRDQVIAKAIEEAIQARMPRHTPLINVAVEGATVSLTGHVANQATKDALIQLAHSTSGVINVLDSLVVGGLHRPLFDWVEAVQDLNQDITDVDRTGDL
jgi:osmotically-inducible protein OsmY